MNVFTSRANISTTGSSPGRLLFIVNDLAFLISHRLPVARAARDAGYDVHIAAPADLASERHLSGMGFQIYRLGMHRHAINPFRELHSFWNIYRACRRLNPDMVHLITIKPVLYGGISARFARVPAVVSAISGLGSAFSGRNARSRIISLFVNPLYRFALGHRAQSVIFQNDDDRITLENLGVPEFLNDGIRTSPAIWKSSK